MNDNGLVRLAERTARHEYQAVVFDLDGTLYSSSAGIEVQIVPSIKREASKRLALPMRETVSLLNRYNEEFGHCVLGLESKHGIDATDFLNGVYTRIDRSRIACNPALRTVLTNLARTTRLALITNCNQLHARLVLEKLDLRSLFSAVFAIEDSGFHLKPDPEAYRRLLKNLQLSASDLLMFDDSVRNLQACYRLGMDTVLVSNGIAESPLFWEMHLQVFHTTPSYVTHGTHNLVQTLRSMLPADVPHA